MKLYLQVGIGILLVTSAAVVISAENNSFSFLDFQNSSDVEEFLINKNIEDTNQHKLNFKTYSQISIQNVRNNVNVTHNMIDDAHNTVFLFWGRNNSEEIFLETKDHFEDYKSRPFYYKLKKNNDSQWKIKNITASISAKKVQRIVSRNNIESNEFPQQDSVKKFRMKILPNGSTRLIVAVTKNEENIKIFRTNIPTKKNDFFHHMFLDYSDNMLSFCGFEDDIASSLLTTSFFPRQSRKLALNFTISVSNVLCIDPMRNFPDTYLSSLLDEPLLDVKKVSNTRGVLIASQFIYELSVEDSRMLDVQHLRTMITYNHGRQWQILKLQNDCQTGPSEPNLYLDQKFSRIHFDQNHLGILDVTSSPGVLISTGHLVYRENPSDTFPGVFVSQDGGLNWKKVFHERLMLSMIHPKWEIILAVRNCLGGNTKRIYLSNDLGISWKHHDLFEKDVCIHEVVSGGWSAQSSVFVILSTSPFYDGWIITLIDFKDLLMTTKTCKKSETEVWPSKNSEHFCVHGRKVLKQRRKTKRLCDVSSVENAGTKYFYNCTCSNHDLVCDNDKLCPPLSKKLLMEFRNIYSNLHHRDQASSSSKFKVKGAPLQKSTNLTEDAEEADTILPVSYPDKYGNKLFRNISNDNYFNFLKSLGYVKPRHNFCYVTKSVFSKKVPNICEDNLDKMYYFTSRAPINNKMASSNFLYIISFTLVLHLLVLVFVYFQLG